MERLLIIIPAYNEERAIGNVLEDISTHYPSADVIVINDGSADATSDVVRKCGVPVIELPHNLGIGGAMQTGYKYAREKGYNVAIQCDGDGQHRADQLESIVKPVFDGDADMVIGSRFLGEKGYQSKLTRLVGIKFLSVLLSFLCRTKITDPTSGFRAVNSKLIEFYSNYYPEDYPEPEAVILLHRAGFRVKEVPTLMKERETGRSSITAIRAIYYMIKVFLAILIDMIKKIPGR